MYTKYTAENLPKKFEFVFTGTTSPVYVYEGGKYYSYDCGHKYEYPMDKSVVINLLNTGTYVLNKNLDEPELVFPFTFTYKDQPRVYTAHNTSLNGLVNITWDGDYCNDYNTEHVKQCIKDGTWIVKSVGEGKIISGSVKAEAIQSSWLGIAGKSVEAPPSPLKIAIDSSDIDAATLAMKRLESAVEAVNVSLESMRELMGEMGNGTRKTGAVVQAV